MIVLLTVLVVLILTRATLSRQISSSSSGQQKADQIAQGGLQEILNDLRQEIAAGSSPRTSSTITTYNSANVALPDTTYQTGYYNSTNIYIPTSNLSSVPAFNAGYFPTNTATDYFPNLLKKSAYNATFFPATNPAVYSTNYPPSNLASQLNTAMVASLDGRSISANRWNKPMLMDPVALTNDFTAPDWILVTRSGPQPFAAWSPTLNDASNSTNYVVGRYAYTIYDEGGMLDANTAGCNQATSPSSGSKPGLTTDFDKSRKRGRLGQADLTALPGLAQADIDQIVNWRNATTANASSNAPQTYFDYLFHGSFLSGSFQYNTTADPTSAFLKTLNGDQTFLSRQDLLNFFDFTFGVGATQDQALPYLGTFSRELNAPSYCPPDPNPTSNNTISTAPSPIVAAQYNYADNAESAILPGTGKPNPNRNFPSVKFAYGGTLPDGTIVTAGEPLVRRRFALSRLQLIENKIVNNDSSNDTAIHNYFGLIYDSSTSTTDPTAGKWIYTSPDSTTVASSIKTLDQVAQLKQPREPDFFELLQAGILNGSLGKTAGTDLNGNSTSGSETVQHDSYTDYQIIQIGVNIIDQYGADPAPTTVEYGGSDTTADPDHYDFYGIENLPYISKISQTIYRPEEPGVDPVTGNGNPQNKNQPWTRPFVAAWLQFELWNPHQNPQAGPALPLRIYAEGSLAVVAFTSADPANPIYSDNNGGIAWYQWVNNGDPHALVVNYGPKTFTSSETISVPTTAYTQADYFREPATLTTDLGATASAPEDHVHQVNKYSQPNAWDFIGLKTGEAFDSDGNAEDNYNNSDTTPEQPMNAQDFGVTTYYPSAPTSNSDGPFSPSNPGGVTFYLQCEYNGQWRTIQRIKNCVVDCDTPGSLLPSLWIKGDKGDFSTRVPCESEYLSQVGPNFSAANGYPRVAYRMLPDPRTDRFGTFESYQEDPMQPQEYPATPKLVGPAFNETLLPSVLGNLTRGLFGYIWDYGRMRVPSTWSNNTLFGARAQPYPYNGWYDQVPIYYQGAPYYYGQSVPPGVWAGLLNFNSNHLPAQITNGPTTYPSMTYYYADNDGIIRGGDGYYANGYDEDANGYLDGYVASMPSAMGSAMASAGPQRPERPVMLSRPFRSPAELGYVHRGEPWKSLDFFTGDSADAGLLDLFSIDDEDVVAGTVDLNTRQIPVLQAILQGVDKNELATTTSDPNASTTTDQNNVDPILSAGASGDANALATALVKERLGTTAAAGPLANRSELVTRFMGQNAASTAYTAFPLNKTRREAVIRPLAAVGNTRTWNLLIDIIAQSGRYPSNASTLGQFQIEGEKRYWWHVAIDRFTGQIVDSQLEPVYE